VRSERYRYPTPPVPAAAKPRARRALREREVAYELRATDDGEDWWWDDVLGTDRDCRECGGPCQQFIPSLGRVL